MAPQDFAIKETTQVPSEGILLQIVQFTKIAVIIVSHLFLNDEMKFACKVVCHLICLNL